MNKILALVVSVLFLAASSFGQTEKGKFVLDQNISTGFIADKHDDKGFSYDGQEVVSKSTNFEIEFNPSVGYFIIDNLAIGSGINFNYSYSKDDDIKGAVTQTNINKNYTYMLTPFAKYYIGETKLRPYVGAQLNVGWGVHKHEYSRDPVLTYFPTSDDKTRAVSSVIGFQVNPGVSYFISDRVSLDLNVYYKYMKLSSENYKDDDRDSIGARAGLSIFF